MGMVSNSQAINNLRRNLDMANTVSGICQNLSALPKAVLPVKLFFLIKELQESSRFGTQRDIAYAMLM
jgi:hypothetical protein